MQTVREKTGEHAGVTGEPCFQRLCVHSTLDARIPTHVFSLLFFLSSVLELTRLLTIVLVVVLSAAIPAAAGEALDDVDVTLEPDNQTIIDAGRGVYQSHCASCHGKQLEGQAEWRKRLDNGMLPAPPHDKTGHTWHHADDLLFEMTKYGVAKVIDDPGYLTMMPVFGSVLEDKDIIAVLSYIKSTWPAKERAWQEKVNSPSKSGLAETKEKSWLERIQVWIKRL